MFRKLIAVGLSASVHAAALGAPLVHAHLDDHEVGHHHGAPTVHAHFSGHVSTHDSQGPSLDDTDAERIVSLQLFVAVAGASFEGLQALPESFEPVVPAAVPPRGLLHVVYGHDPPFARSRPSRAPPASLS